MSTVLNEDLLSALGSYLAARKSSSSVARQATRIISAMGGQPPSSIAKADAAIASAADLWRLQGKSSWWNRIRPGQRDDRRLLADEPDLAFLFIFHRDGLLRQAALDRISGPIPNAFLVAAICWRLNDWVLEVRESALACAQRCWPKTDPNFLAQFFFGTVLNMNSWGRWSSDEQEVLHLAVSNQEVRDQFATRLSTGVKGPLPSVLSYMLRYDWIDPYLATLASQANVPGVRAIALRSLICGSATYSDGTIWRWFNKPMGVRKREPKIVERPLGVEHDPLTLIRAGIVDSSAVVRRVALSGIIEHKLYDALDIAVIEHCSEDHSASVRSRADFILRKIATGT